MDFRYAPFLYQEGEMLSVGNTVLLIIDIQEKLFRVMYEKEPLIDNARKLIQGCRVLGVPVLLTEQYSKGLGPTVAEVTELIPEVAPLEKLSFGCCGDEGFMRALKAVSRKQVLITGIETHVCVYQTAAALLEMGYEVQVVADAVSSRTARNRDISLEKMRDMGAGITSVEIALFELLETAGSDKFRDISQIVK
jgi:nicotinamidase-related amidase